MNEIKTVIFDWAGVFCSPGELFSLPRLLETTGLTAAKMEARVRPVQDEYYRGKISSQDYWRHVFEEFGLEGFSVEELNDAYLASYRPYPEILAIPETLKSRYTVALLSNLTEEMMEHVIASHDLEPKFHQLFFSNRMGRLKPEPEIYIEALEKLGAEPQTTLFIDDSQKNLNAAAGLGLQTLLSSSPEQLEQDLSYKIISPS